MERSQASPLRTWGKSFSGSKTTHAESLMQEITCYVLKSHYVWMDGIQGVRKEVPVMNLGEEMQAKFCRTYVLGKEVLFFYQKQ